jgi:hypothetical protein
MKAGMQQVALFVTLKVANLAFFRVSLLLLALRVVELSNIRSFTRMEEIGLCVAMPLTSTNIRDCIRKIQLCRVAVMQSEILSACATWNLAIALG